MSYKWAMGGRWAVSHKLKIQNLSRVCPRPMSVQNLSNAEKCGFGVLLLDTVLTNTGFSCQISVHEYLLGQGLDRPRTAIGQNLNLVALSTDLGQGLDNLWTEVGFYVQSLSNQPMGTSTSLCISTLARRGRAAEGALAFFNIFSPQSSLPPKRDSNNLVSAAAGGNTRYG